MAFVAQQPFVLWSIIGDLYQCFLAGKKYFRVMNENTLLTTNA